MLPVSNLETKLGMLNKFLLDNNKELFEGSFKVELSLRKHINYEDSLKVIHIEIGNYYYADDIEVDTDRNIVSIFYKEYGFGEERKNVLKII